MDEKQYLLKKLQEAGCKDVVLNKVFSNKKQLKFANNEIVVTTNWEGENISIFVNYQGKTVVTDINIFTKEEIDKKVKEIVSFAKAMQINEEFKAIAKGPFKYKQIKDLYDSKIDKVDSVKLVHDGVSEALKNGAKRCSGVLELESYDRELLTSNKVSGKDKGTFAYFSMRANYDKLSSGYQNRVSTLAKDLDTKKLGAKAGEIALMAKNPEKISPGKFDVVFESYPFAGLVEQMGHSASINRVESGFSCLANMTNKKVSSNLVTLYDNGILPRGIGSSIFDEEGFPHSNTKLIDKGTFKTYLHNTSTALRYKTKNTGNSGILGPHPTNLVLESGKNKNLLDGFTGLYITNVWYTRFQNYVTGDFSTIPRDGIFMYKNGKIVKTVKDIRVTDNLINLFKNISGLSKDRFHHQGWEVETPVLCPLAKIKKVNISASTE